MASTRRSPSAKNSWDDDVGQHGNPDAVRISCVTVDSEFALKARIRPGSMPDFSISRSEPRDDAV